MLTGAASGAACLVRGQSWWRSRPRLLALGLLPALLVAAVLLAALVALGLTVGGVVAALTPFADDWPDLVRGLVRLLLALALLVAALVLSSLVFTGLTLAVGDPFYERIWATVEESLGDPPRGSDLGWWSSVRDGLALAGLGVVIALGLLVLGLLPVVGAALGAATGLLVSGRLLAGELLGRPLEARGLDRHARRSVLRRHRARVWGFGVAAQACFLVPGGAVAVMPGAVVGATLLARELLADDAAVPGAIARRGSPTR